MLRTQVKTLPSPADERGTPTSKQLRLRIVEENLLIFLVATSLSAVCMWSFAQPFSVMDILISFGPFVAVNVAALWLARHDRMKQAVWLYTITVATMQVSSVLIFGGVRVHIVISMINLVLLIGVAIGAKAALLMSILPTLLFAVGYWLTDGSPLVVGLPLPKVTPTLTFIATTSTLVSTGFVVNSTLRVLWAHVDHSADSVAALTRARDDLDERHRWAAELTDFSKEMLGVKDVESAANALARAAVSLDAIGAVAVLDRSHQTLAAQGDLASSTDEIAATLGALEWREDYRASRLKTGMAGVYGLQLGSGKAPSGFLVLQTEAEVDLSESGQAFIAAVSQAMVSTRLRVESEERYRRTQRMETLGQFTGGIAHDFNNLLTTILGSAELALMVLEDSEPKPGEVHKHVEVARAGALQAGDLVGKLLAFARRTPRESSRLNLAEYIQAQEAFLRSTVGEGVATTFDYPSEATWVDADPIEIQQVLLNLLANARDAMDLKGAIEVSLGRLDDRYMTIRVADSGPGIPPAERERVFKPFYSTRAEGSGLGLGLATVSSILEGLGGRIEVTDSTLGGAAFIVYWPLSEAEEPSRDPDAAPTGHVQRGELMLIVDDDSLVRETIAAMLTALGHKALQAEDVSGALSLLRRTPEIALVITDFMMPGQNGRDLLRAMRETGDKRPAIMVSGYEESAEFDERTDVEPQARMGKPFTLGELQVTLGRVLQPRAER